MRLGKGICAVVMAMALQCASAAAQEVPPPPSGPVAQVGAVPIPLAEFEHWLAQATHAAFGRPLEFVAPAYEQCAAVKQRRRVKRGWRKLGKRELRSRCASDQRSLRRMALQFLVQAQWVEQEADVRGVGVSEQRVEQIFKTQKHAAFPKESDYQRFLRKSGADETGIKYRVRLDALQVRLTRYAVGKAKPVTAGDVARYRATHPGRFTGMSSARARRKARRLLVERHERVAVLQFISDFRSRYRAITWCAEGHKISECGAVAPAS